MAQAAPASKSSERRRRNRARDGREGGSGRNRPDQVPELLERRRSGRRRPRRNGLLPFALGVTVGWGLASPAVQQLPATLAGLMQAPRGLASWINPAAHGHLRVLVLGRDQVGDNTDVMFTVRVRDGITEITQVPRDTFIETPELGAVKVNSLYELAGVETTKSEVGKLIGAPIGRYFKLNLNAVAKVADALGGVEVDVPQRMFYVDQSQGLYIDLHPGRQLLRGKDLEGFLRFRHDALGDLGRMERQRLVMARVFARLAEPATLARLPQLVQIAGNDILTDLSPVEMTQLMAALAHTRLSTQRLPGRLYWQNNLSFWMPDSNRDHPTGSGEEPL